MPPKINHPLHIVLSVLTGGLWLIVYAFLLWEDGKQGGAAARIASMEAQTAAIQAETARILAARRGNVRAYATDAGLARAEGENELRLAFLATTDPAAAGGLRASLAAASASGIADGVHPSDIIRAYDDLAHDALRAVPLPGGAP